LGTLGARHEHHRAGSRAESASEFLRVVNHAAVDYVYQVSFPNAIIICCITLFVY